MDGCKLRKGIQCSRECRKSAGSIRRIVIGVVNAEMSTSNSRGDRSASCRTIWKASSPPRWTANASIAICSASGCQNWTCSKTGATSANKSFERAPGRTCTAPCGACKEPSTINVHSRNPSGAQTCECECCKIIASVVVSSRTSLGNGLPNIAPCSLHTSRRAAQNPGGVDVPGSISTKTTQARVSWSSTKGCGRTANAQHDANCGTASSYSSHNFCFKWWSSTAVTQVSLRPSETPWMPYVMTLKGSSEEMVIPAVLVSKTPKPWKTT